MPDQKPAIPLGVTVLVTDQRGDQVGAASDFLGDPGSQRFRELQEARANAAAWWEAFDRTCRKEVATAINQGGLTFDDLRRKLMDQGWREHVIVHGHGEDE